MTAAIDYTEVIMAVGALGAAAAALVEAIKVDAVKSIGFGELAKILTSEVLKTLSNVYGPQYENYLKSLYRESRREGRLKSLLRQGFRIALTKETASTFARVLPTLSSEALAGAANAIAEGQTPSQENSIALGRFEAALDARIEAALASADQQYIWTMRLLATAFSVAISVLVALFDVGPSRSNVGFAIIVGLAAVPLAPIAKDLVSAISAVRRTFEQRP